MWTGINGSVVVGFGEDRRLKDMFQGMVLQVDAVCSAMKARSGGSWIWYGSRGRDQVVEKKLWFGVDEFKEA